MLRIAVSIVTTMACLILSGCVSMEDRATQASALYSSGIVESNAGDFDKAQQLFTQARSQLTVDDNPPNDYFTDRYYLGVSQVDSSRAYAYFIQSAEFYSQGKDWHTPISQSDKLYRQAIEDLREGTQREVEILESKAKWKQTGRVVGATVLGIMAAMADASQTQSNMYNAQASGAGSYEVSNKATENYLEFLNSAREQGFFDMPDIEPVPLALGGSPDKHSVRFPVMPNQGYFKSIGKLINETESAQCTAFIVSKRIAITNAHCVSEGGTLYWSEEEVSKLPKRHDVLLWATADGAFKKRNLSALPGNDWAVIILDKSASDLPSLTILPGHLSEYPDKSFSHALLAGYNGDLNSGYYLTAHFGCQISGVVSGFSYTPLLGKTATEGDAIKRFFAQDLEQLKKAVDKGKSPDHAPFSISLNGGLLHNCDTYFGSSGAPILIYSREHKAYFVAGINQGQYKDLPQNGPLRNQRIGVSVSAFYPTFEVAKHIVDGNQI